MRIVSLELLLLLRLVRCSRFFWAQDCDALRPWRPSARIHRFLEQGLLFLEILIGDLIAEIFRLRCNRVSNPLGRRRSLIHDQFIRCR